MPQLEPKVISCLLLHVFGIFSILLIRDFARFEEKAEKIAVYRAAAIATTLLSYCDIGRNLIDYVVDLYPYKYSCFIGGNQLSKYPTSKLLEDKPDCVLLLALNFAEEILNQQSAFREQGGKFIILSQEVQNV